MIYLIFLLTAVLFGKGLNGSLDICSDEINCVGQYNGTFMGDPKDCASYFICVDKKLYQRGCPQGTMFDYVKVGCMNPQQSRHCQFSCTNNSYEKYVVHSSKDKVPFIPTTPPLARSETVKLNISSYDMSTKNGPSSHTVLESSSPSPSSWLSSGIGTSTGSSEVSSTTSLVKLVSTRSLVYSDDTTTATSVPFQYSHVFYENPAAQISTTELRFMVTTSNQDNSSTNSEFEDTTPATNDLMNHLTSSSTEMIHIEASSRASQVTSSIELMNFSPSPAHETEVATKATLSSIVNATTTSNFADISKSQFTSAPKETVSTRDSSINDFLEVTLKQQSASKLYAERSKVTFDCSFQLKNNSVTIQVENIAWFKFGILVKNETFPKERIKVFGPSKQINDTWISSLLITDIRQRDGGESFTCGVIYKINNESMLMEKSLKFSVVAHPVVFLEPLSRAVSRGNSSLMTCAVLNREPETNLSFVWYIDGIRVISSPKMKKYTTSNRSELVVEGIDRDFSVTCSVGNLSLAWGNATASIYITQEADRFCEEERQGNNVWPRLRSGTQAINRCPLSAEGVMTRKCSDSWEKVQVADCLNRTLMEAQEKLDEFSELHNFGLDSPDSFWSKTDNLLKSIDDFLELHQEDGMIPQVLSGVETFGISLARYLKIGESKTYDLRGMILTIKATKQEIEEVIVFPSHQFKPQDFVSIDCESFEGNQEIFFSLISYKHLGYHLPSRNNKTVNSSIISVTAASIRGNIKAKLKKPVKFYYKALNNLRNMHIGVCSFWDMEKNDWSQDGCQLVSGDGGSYCQCDHLTNFALLMSLYPADEFHSSILSIISIIGCIISIVAMGLTLIIFAVKWRAIRSHHLVVVINLCIALIVANIIFLAGVNRTESKEGCTAVAVLLHYFYLAAFFMMFAEGIELMLYIIFVFHVRRRRELLALITLAWVCPFVIVAITLGATQSVAYVSDKSCWLNLNHGVMWAFVGPVLLLVLANLIMLSVVVVRVAGAKRPAEKDKARHRLKTAVWSVVVLTPVLGLTWVFGVLSVSKELVVFQYIFAIFNSLQGFFIFIFHGLRNKKGRPRYKYTRNSSSKHAMQEVVTSRRANGMTSQSTASTSISSRAASRDDRKPSLDSVSMSSASVNFGFQCEDHVITERKEQVQNGDTLSDISEEVNEQSTKHSRGYVQFNDSIYSASV